VIQAVLWQWVKNSPCHAPFDPRPKFKLAPFFDKTIRKIDLGPNIFLDYKPRIYIIVTDL
jgi:hypothetical protein